ncbi:MAG: hypothetical protein U1F17_04965 [Burkholderiaceae bacterium]
MPDRSTRSRCTRGSCTPGIKVVPATAMDAKGLMKTAIRDDNPVLVFEHKQLYRTRWPVPAEYADPDHLEVPFGQAVVRRPGSDITVVALTMLTMRWRAPRHSPPKASRG